MNKYVNTRDFLRNFKIYKTELLSGKIQMVTITIAPGEELRVMPQKKHGSGADILKALDNMKGPLNVKRPNLDKLFFGRKKI